jgi:hypothetical protein
MSTNSNVPGLLLPTTQAPLAGSPGASAMAARNNQSIQQAALANAVGGRRKMRRGGAITVPQMPGDTSGANAVATQNAQNSVQAAANAQYDAAAMKKGGSRRKKGGNPNWSWGCYSGGRRKSKRRTIKRRKSRRNKK